ncbi:DUF802 domain-containing protein [Paraburkholderia sp. MMS20-SJTR3]|uniref:DUF802 domain-containing protein n=1 Tax=Paraburkholderia sejongensis TaxID=2886946 RepID=A0ABS8JT80_9BURK|nr:DUF802 domain-containing protein [Paraburkholderia sp. MMS20-SJTR3]MCC8393063.1 DUF802 domain-containing protein [Paraburkholderia sp. MMS20-SJTR3]
MSRYRIDLVVFLAGLAAACWIAVGYAVANPLAFAVTLLIGVFYVLGALELRRYSQATATLSGALTKLSAPPPSLAAFLEAVHPSLRNPVRLRVEGERAALPGPALTPYLVGLLVLLGMLGTLLGMVMTLRGTALALESASDLQAIRASLAAPVKGLGFAFGTSIAGVSTSAMLGLLSALCRRERLEAAQQLDLKIATALRIYSQSHQRDESFKLLQRQADATPLLVERLQTMMSALEQQSAASNEQQLASLDAFYGRTEAAYLRLAGVIEQSLKDSVTGSARAAGEALQPVVQATLAGLARESATLHESVTQAVQRQLAGMTSGFAATSANVATICADALAGHRQASDALAAQQSASLERVAQAFEQRSAALLDGVSARVEATASQMSQAWGDALAQQQRAADKLAANNEQALAGAAATFERHSAALLEALGRSQSNLQSELAARDEQRLAAWVDTLGAVSTKLDEQWRQSGAHHAARQQEICDALAQTARDISAQTQTHASATLVEIERLVQVAADAPKAAANLQAELIARDEQRFATWTDTLGALAAKLNEQWQHSSVQTASRQQEIFDALTQTARDISAQTQTHASATLAEIDRLVQAAADAPKAAVNLQAELAARDEQRFTAWTEALGVLTAKLTEQWQQSGSQTASRQQEICDALAQTARDISTQTQTHASATLAEIDRLVQVAADAPKAAANLQAELAARDEQRFTTWTDTLGALTAKLTEQWQQTGSQTAARQQQICDALAQTARDISTQTQTHANATIAEIERLVQAASEAPKAAADVIAELRQKLSDSMVRDTAMLDERSRLLATLETLLDAVNHASTEQRAAVDGLVTTSAELLERVGKRFTDHLEHETGKLGEVAAQVTGSAVEVASLGDAFGAAVRVFGEANAKLVAHLERIETALDKSLARSDEQLAYYVAQARDVVDLSVMSQKQIVEDLQLLAAKRARAGADAV